MYTKYLQQPEPCPSPAAAAGLEWPSSRSFFRKLAFVILSSSSRWKVPEDTWHQCQNLVTKAFSLKCHLREKMQWWSKSISHFLLNVWGLRVGWMRAPLSDSRSQTFNELHFVFINNVLHTWHSMFLLQRRDAEPCSSKNVYPIWWQGMLKEEYLMGTWIGMKQRVQTGMLVQMDLEPGLPSATPPQKSAGRHVLCRSVGSIADHAQYSSARNTRRSLFFSAFRKKVLSISLIGSYVYGSLKLVWSIFSVQWVYL